MTNMPTSVLFTLSLTKISALFVSINEGYFNEFVKLMSIATSADAYMMCYTFLALFLLNSLVFLSRHKLTFP